tara:strand:+ start:448 stop:945 length:498 start_codon:yes stop_codon:yes gene_type:complete
MVTETQAHTEKERIIDNMRSIVISTVDDKNNPNVSYAPSLVDEDNFYIYISNLAKHTSNLIDNPKISFMVIEDETISDNIFGRKRFTINASVSQVERDTDKWNTKMDLMEDKFGETITYLKNMKDFHLFEMKPDKGLLVSGFGKAFTFTGVGLNNIIHLNEEGHK